MSQPRQKDPSDPLYDPNDKWNEYKVRLLTHRTDIKIKF
jgi:rRNA maturation protein Nop10